MKSLPSSLLRVASAACVCIALLPATPAFADEPVMLEPVRITAPRLATPVATASASVTVLDADDLASLSGRSVESILATHAGVTLKRTGGPGQQASIFLRGNDSDSTLVIVDGVKFNAGTLGLAPLNILRGSDVERIEVIRGPRSTAHGSEAIGGVVSITTRRQGRLIAIEGGSDDTRDLRARYAQQAGRTAFALGAGRFGTSGDPVTDLATVHGEHENTSGTLRVSHDAGIGRISADALVAEGSTQYLDTFNLVPLHQDFSNHLLSLALEAEPVAGLQVRARLGHVRDLLRQQETGFSPTPDFAETERRTLALELARDTGGFHWEGGIDSEREFVSAQSFGTVLDVANDNTGVFLLADWTPGKNRLSAGTRYTAYDSFGGHWTGEASAGRTLWQDTFGWLAASTGFRAPDAGERFGFGGNPALEPEQGASTEAGIRRQIGRHELSLTGFVQRTDHLIAWVGGTNINIRRARTTGTEIGWRRRSADLDVHALVSLLDPVDHASGTRLLLRPEKQLSTGVRLRIGERTWLTGDLLAMDERIDFTGPLAGFGVANAGVEWRPHSDILLRARIENLADRHYVLATDSMGSSFTTAAYRMPDRAGYLALEWTLP